jgi:opacity protein-like surface antigen
MRSLLVALSLFGFVAHAGAQDFDMPTLRGSSPFIPAKPQYTRWQGIYAGGQVGHVSAHMDFRSSFDSANIFDLYSPLGSELGSVRNWAGFDKGDKRSTSYGGFIGYNSMWDNVVVGIEGNYHHTSLSGSSSDRCVTGVPLCPGTVDINTIAYNADITATASLRVTDYGTIRTRGGWAAGNFLPYATVGIAVARAEYTKAATATFTPVNPADPAAASYTETVAGTRFTWGFAVGAGIDWLVMPNVFVRGEYEYIGLNPVGDIRVNIGTARVGAGLRF